MKTALICGYIFAGFGSIAFGAIIPDLLALGVQEEVASIISVMLTTIVTAIGAVALYVGLPLPEIPRKDEV